MDSLTLRWAVIGHGDVVEFKSGPALQRAAGSLFEGVLGRDADRAAAFADRFGVPRVYARLDELLADPEIDAVYVATPVASHAGYTIAAARAGKHVLVEKPMALTQDECQQMVAVCRRHNVRLGVAYYRRFYPVVARIRALLAEGALGSIVFVRAQYATFNRLPIESWRFDPAISAGGVLADVGSHRLDLLLHLLGPARTVSALGDAASPSSVEDAASVLIGLASGVQAFCGAYWRAGARCDELELSGSSGRLIASPLEDGLLRRYRGGDLVEEDRLPRPGPPHLGLVEDFVAAVREGRDPLCNGEQGAATNALLLAAYQAMRSGQPVGL